MNLAHGLLEVIDLLSTCQVDGGGCHNRNIQDGLAIVHFLSFVNLVHQIEEAKWLQVLVNMMFDPFSIVF
jgi:hypothetical protein